MPKINRFRRLSKLKKRCVTIVGVDMLSKMAYLCGLQREYNEIHAKNIKQLKFRY